MTKRIIAFDSWTEGRVSLEPVASALKQRGYELLLIHVGSWGHDIGRPTEEMMGDIRVRDISYYKGQNILRIIQLEAPEAAVLLSTRPLAHMTFNKYCKHLSIPTCHLYHGLVSIQAVGDGEKPYKLNYLSHIQKIFKQAPKNLRYIFPSYFGALIRTRAPLSAWWDFFLDLSTRVVHSLGKTEFIKGTDTDIGCVYIDLDIEHMVRNYNVDPDRIMVVGNPDLAKFGLTLEMVGSGFARTKARKIVYIDTALLEANVAFGSINEFVQHIADTKAACAALGFDFVFKSHPANRLNGVDDALREADIKFVTSDEFVECLQNCAAAIVEPSSAALLPAIFGLPLILPQYGPLAEIAFGRVILTYPFSIYLHQLDNLSNVLEKAEEQRAVLRPDVRSDFDNWVVANIGPLPAKDMPHRVADFILAHLEAR